MILRTPDPKGSWIDRTVLEEINGDGRVTFNRLSTLEIRVAQSYYFSAESRLMTSPIGSLAKSGGGGSS